MAQFFAIYLVYVIILLIVFFILKTESKKNRRYYMFSLVPGLIALTIKKLMALFLEIPRPDINYGFDSFPSGHTSFLFGIAWFIFLKNKKVGLIFLVLALINGIARILLNYHYPIDILGGTVLGFLVAYVTLRFFSSAS